MDEKAEILLIERGPDISYANCGLPYYIGGIIAERERLFVQTPEGFRRRFQVEVRTLSEAVRIDRERRIVADNIASGNRKRYRGALNTAIAKVFDLTVASTGLSEKTLKAEGIPYLSSITHSASHAGYYPGALPMSLKILFAPDSGKLYGAQIVGYQGVDKRIDVLAAILRQGGSVYDLQELEHAYAPPYSSAKDPVNTAGFVAGNMLSGLVENASWSELASGSRDGLFLLDVREPEEHELGTIAGAVNIPLASLRERIAEVPRDRRVVVFCGVGLRAYLACRILRQNGYPRVYNLSGGYKTYEFATQKQSNEDIFAKDIVGKDDTIYQADVEARLEAGGAAVPQHTVEVDACGLQCPGPIVRLKQEIDRIPAGGRLREIATDPGFRRDVEAWCAMTGHRLLKLSEEGGKTAALIEKKAPAPAAPGGAPAGANTTLVVFSDDFDRALAAFVIANGAAAAGKKVTMFFTFRGLNVIKKQRKPAVRKDFMGRMFSWMLPKHSGGLKLSKLNMLGMGARMMRGRMQARKIASLEEMIRMAAAGGVQMVACQMSMEVMGVKREELIDEASIGGVAAYLGEAEKGAVNLFI